jgi:hypothetical protein
MSWVDEALELLCSRVPCGYEGGLAPATEPTAWTVLALVAHGRNRDAKRGLDWLNRLQADDGSFGVNAANRTPKWATGLVVLACLSAIKGDVSRAVYPRDQGVKRAIDWIVGVEGTTIEHGGFAGHDTTLVGWPWIEGTHSWVEPTAFNILALNSLFQKPQAACFGRCPSKRKRWLPETGTG